MRDAYMSSNYYIKKVFIPFSQHNETDINQNCRFILFSDINPDDDYMGITGVPVVADEKLAKADCERKSPDAFINWLKVEIDEKELFLSLEETLGNQSTYIQDTIFKSENLNLLFADEAKVIYDKAESQTNEDDGENKVAYIKAQLHLFAEKKKEYLINFTGREYINFLNKRNLLKDSEQTTAYLYDQCHIKGISYLTEAGEHRFLIFNAKEDITVKDIFRGK